MAGKEKGKEVIEKIVEKTEPIVEEAKAKAEPVIEEAKAKAAPVVKEAKKKAEPVVKEAKKKASSARKTTKDAAKKATKTTKKAAKAVAEAIIPDKTAVYVQYAGREFDTQALLAEAKKIYLEQDSPYGPVGTINLYVKPEDNAAYYVINDAFTGAISL